MWWCAVVRGWFGGGFVRECRSVPCKGWGHVVGVACPCGDREGGEFVWGEVDDVIEPWRGGESGGGGRGGGFDDGLLQGERVEESVIVGL